MDEDKAAIILEFQDKHKTYILTTFPLIFHKAISFKYFLKVKLSHSVKAGTNRQDFDLNIYFLLIHNRSLHLRILKMTTQILLYNKVNYK